MADADAALHGLHALVANMCASRPLVLAIDDAHWMDSASLRLALFLLRRLRDLRVAMLLALRSGEPQAEGSLFPLLISSTRSWGESDPRP